MTSIQNQSQQTLPQVTQQNYNQQNYSPQQVQGYTNIPQQLQTQAPPSYAGVNIQIYNPSVGIPSINPTGNLPQSQSLPGIAYPSNYYTQQFVPPQGGIIAQGGQGGNAVVNNTINTPPINENSNNNGLTNGAINAGNTQNSAENTEKTTTVKETSETTNKTDDKKKTEKRKIVELTDEYIKNLENYLNSQDKEVRMMGAKEVVARLQEDDSRKDDPALTALINKMLQDPNQQIRFLALSMLDSRTCTGNDYTVGVLKNMQNSTSGYGQDAAQATNILLKMSGNIVEKEFEIPEKTDKK